MRLHHGKSEKALPLQKHHATISPHRFFSDVISELSRRYQPTGTGQRGRILPTAVARVRRASDGADHFQLLFPHPRLSATRLDMAAGHLQLSEYGRAACCLQHADAVVYWFLSGDVQR